MAFVQAQEEEIQTKAQALAVAYDENVSGWIRSVQLWMQGQAQEHYTLVEIQQGTHLPLIKLWLALLLGQFEIEQQGDFYERDSIVIHRPV